MMYRNPTNADIPRMVELGRLMHRESRFRGRNFNPDKVANLMAGMIADKGGKTFILVAEKGDRIVGGIMAAMVEDWFGDDSTTQDVAIFIDPNERGQMAASRLIVAYEMWSQSLGCVAAELGVNTGVNPDRTSRMLEVLGFQRVAYLHSKEFACASVPA